MTASRVEPMSASRVEPMAASRREPVPTLERTSLTTASTARATIGRSITIRGEVTGDEDLLIQGRVDGSVNLKQHTVTVGADGEVKANVIGRVVTVEGSVEGNLTADEQVILRSSAQVEGDIAAPRVVLEDGARFRGGVDMGGASGRHDRTAASEAHATSIAETGRPASIAETGRPAEASLPQELSASTDDDKSKSGGSKAGASHSSTR